MGCAIFGSLIVALGTTVVVVIPAYIFLIMYCVNYIWFNTISICCLKIRRCKHKQKLEPEEDENDDDEIYPVHGEKV